jgi:hypothetical protein
VTTRQESDLLVVNEYNADKEALNGKLKKFYGRNIVGDCFYAGLLIFVLHIH